MFRKISLQWVFQNFSIYYSIFTSYWAFPSAYIYTYFQIFLWKKSMPCTQQIKLIDIDSVKYCEIFHFIKVFSGLEIH